MDSQSLGLRTTLELPYEQALDATIAALKAEGFGVLTQIDVQATMKAKLGADFQKYAILGACNPPLAHRALNAVLDIGLLLPCNVIVYEEGDHSVVALLDPLSMLDLFDNADLVPVAQEAAERLHRVAASLASSGETTHS
ncbi:MAG: DUF302 domain-containing protein [Anaerolineae bacterium]